jgi:hypothetical protein
MNNQFIFYAIIFGNKKSLLMRTTLFFFVILLFTMNTTGQQKNNFEDWEDRPPVVEPAKSNLPPSDAVMLFDGGSLDKWQYHNGTAPQWVVSENSFTVKLGEPDILTKQKFGNCQLHVEWKVPDEPHKNLNWGNSGIYLMGLYEVQTYDSYNYEHEIYYLAGATIMSGNKQPNSWKKFFQPVTCSITLLH